jgi:hypothetical protein
VADRSAVYRITPRDRRVERIYVPPAGETIVGVMHHAHSEDTKSPRDAVFVATEKRLHVIPPLDRPVKAFDLPLHGTPGERHVQVVYLRDTDTAVVWYQDMQSFTTYGKAQRLLAFDATGKVLRDETLPPLQRFEAIGPRPLAPEVPMYASVSLADAGVIYGVGSLLGDRTENGPLAETRVLTTVVATALLCAIAGYLLARRRALSQPRRVLWAAGGATFALPGVLTMLSLPQMPARVACPNCGLRRIVTRDACEHCAALFAPPARDGTEIFE